MKPQIKKIGLYRLSIERKTNIIHAKVLFGGVVIGGTTFNQFADDVKIENWAEKQIESYENETDLNAGYGNMI